MEFKLAKNKLKQSRKRRLWSQEELSAASGLGLRTIQRAEGEGVASAETLRALAATLQLDRDDLLDNNEAQLPYLNTQLGYVTAGSMILVALIATLIFSRGSMSADVFAVLCSVCAVVAGLFATLTTQVDESRIRWHFGVGLISKSVSLPEVESHRVVRNKAWWGWGIRLIPDGWLYNVSGLDAVELRFKDGRAARIGTDEPEALNAAIERALLQYS